MYLKILFVMQVFKKIGYHCAFVWNVIILHHIPHEWVKQATWIIIIIDCAFILISGCGQVWQRSSEDEKIEVN